MNFALQAALFVISFLVVYLLRPKIEGPVPSTLDEFDIPKTQEGDEIGRVYGTVWVSDAQVVWYGDFTTQDVKAPEGKK